MTGELTIATNPARGVMPEVASVCSPHLTPETWSSIHSLAELKRDGLLERVPEEARQAKAACTPVDANRLIDRLTALGMMMAPSRPRAEAAIWLREMARLLGDLPEDILSDAIDAIVKTCKFLPTVAEIRELADPVMERRRTVAARCDAMARLLASGQPIPDLPRFDWREMVKEPEPVCTPEQAAEIMREFGLKANPVTNPEHFVDRHV